MALSGEITSTSRGKLITGIVVALAAFALLAYFVWDQGAERRAIRNLPAQERRALYERTLRTLESSCDPKTRPEGLADYCHDQAKFIAQFPECDAACSDLVKRNEAMPAR